MDGAPAQPQVAAPSIIILERSKIPDDATMFHSFVVTPENTGGKVWWMDGKRVRAGDKICQGVLKDGTTILVHDRHGNAFDAFSLLILFIYFFVIHFCGPFARIVDHHGFVVFMVTYLVAVLVPLGSLDVARYSVIGQVAWIGFMVGLGCMLVNLEAVGIWYAGTG